MSDSRTDKPAHTLAKHKLKSKCNQRQLHEKSSMFGPVPSAQDRSPVIFAKIRISDRKSKLAKFPINNFSLYLPPTLILNLRLRSLVVAGQLYSSTIQTLVDVTMRNPLGLPQFSMRLLSKELLPKLLPVTWLHSKHLNLGSGWFQISSKDQQMFFLC